MQGRQQAVHTLTGPSGTLAPAGGGSSDPGRRSWRAAASLAVQHQHQPPGGTGHRRHGGVGWGAHTGTGPACKAVVRGQAQAGPGRLGGSVMDSNVPIVLRGAGRRQGRVRHGFRHWGGAGPEGPRSFVEGGAGRKAVFQGLRVGGGILSRRQNMTAAGDAGSKRGRRCGAPARAQGHIGCAQPQVALQGNAPTSGSDPAWAVGGAWELHKCDTAALGSQEQPCRAAQPLSLSLPAGRSQAHPVLAGSKQLWQPAGAQALHHQPHEWSHGKLPATPGPASQVSRCPPARPTAPRSPSATYLLWLPHEVLGSAREETEPR